MSEKTGTGILCPSCGAPDMEVTDSRPGDHYIRRRRLCTCGQRFTTVEVIVQGNAAALEAAGLQRAFDALPLDRRVLVRQLIRELA